MAKEEAKQKITELVKKYESLSQSEIKAYHEAKTKQGFIEPLFRALGWDFDNTDEVAPEESASKGRVDYALKLNGISQFYVEAKSLKEDINDPKHIKQAVTYAYNKGITWAVLTNFEGLRIFNAQKQSQSITLDYKQYTEDFDRLWLLSRESLETGLLTKEAQKWGILPPPLPVETRLFTQLRQWREELFNQLYGHNKKLLNFSQIDKVIQRLFNRLIFIRNAEDRGIEEKRLLSAVNQWKTDGRKKDELRKALRQIFHDFDGYYDSDLFASHLLDNEKLFIEEQTIENILSGLYEIPGSMASYDFSVIDADVLGVVYEQYLGYVAVKAKEKAEAQLKLGITDDEVFTVIGKKPHRKEQGIYYTPKFVTNYIVKETVGRFIKERSDQEVLNMKILDPACGSGSFLIRAYDELLNYHADQRGKAVSEIDQGERLPILTNNIFGVDLDMQAVEIARLNLLLRSLARRETLPSLADNIKQGNSLISGTPEELKKYFGQNYKKNRPFDWENQFKDILANGGFDVVIGNPPYGADFDEQDRHYIEDYYPLSKDNKNSAMVFIERGLNLTKEGGFFSFIIPKSLAYSQKWLAGRKYILEKLGYACDTSKAFKEVLLEQMVIVVSQKYVHKPYYEAAFLNEDGLTDKVAISKKVSNAADTILLGITDEELNIFNKMISSNVFLRDISSTARGLSFQRYLAKNQDGVPIYRGDNIGRYVLHKNLETISQDVLDNAAKKVSFLKQPKIMSQQIIAHIQNPTDHIILMSYLDKEGVLTLDTVQNTIVTDKRYSLEFVTGLLNSTLWSWYAYRFIFSKAIRTMHFDGYYIGKFPLPEIDLAKPNDEGTDKTLPALVNKMLETSSKLQSLPKEYFGEREELTAEMKETDKAIDDLVYTLYKLSEDDIELVTAGLSLVKAKKP